MKSDALDPENDPYPAPGVSRRSLALLPAVLVLSCRAPRRLVCAPQAADREHCAARFCRHHAARAG